MIIGRGELCKACVPSCCVGGLACAAPIGIVATMPAVPLTPEQLFRRLDVLRITHQTVSHPPVFTVAEAAAVRGQSPGGHCKSLFFKDKKRGFWLVIMLEERRIDLNKLAIRLAAPRFSFGAAADLEVLLGVRPGSVTPVRAGQRWRASGHSGTRPRDA